VTGNDLCFTSAIELIELYEQRSVSPVEVTEAVLARIDLLNPSLNAFITVTHELALEQARAAERAYRDGAAGALAGVPISIKDLMLTKGIRTTRGSLIYADLVPDEDAPFVEHVRAAGAVILGKTNTPEFGWKGESTNRIVGSTHNPWQLGRTAGGSSGGGAAAVAAGLGPLAQGSDGAGSIRIPCGFCGIFGFKPSFGLVPNYPASSVGDLSHVGPMTRTVADAALLMNATAGADPRDRWSWSSNVDYVEAIKRGVKGLHIGWSADLGYAAVDPIVRQTAEAAVRRFEEAGCLVEETSPGLDDPWEIIDVLWSCGQAGATRDNFQVDKDRLDPGLVEVIERGRQTPATDFALAMMRRNAYAEKLRRFTSQYDLFLTPTLPITAFPAGKDQPGSIQGRPTSYLSWTAFTYPFNMSGQPAATVPCGFDHDGLPIGLQIVGRFHDDVTVMRAAKAFEELAPWRHLRPPEPTSQSLPNAPRDV
jgi:aspartyl-tRNA(Asn)/glutamyl-tRNA(Gln) amidotransferase subunit A